MRPRLLSPVLAALLAAGGLPVATAEDEPASATEQRPYLGVSVDRVPAAVAAQLRLPPEHGLLVLSVVPESPAAAAGLTRHDVLVALDDQDLVNGAQLHSLLAARAVGEEVLVHLRRAGEALTLAATLGARPAQPRHADDDPAAQLDAHLAVMEEHLRAEVAERLAKARARLHENQGEVAERIAEARARVREHQAEIEERLADIRERLGDDRDQYRERIRAELERLEALRDQLRERNGRHFDGPARLRGGDPILLGETLVEGGGVSVTITGSGDQRQLRVRRGETVIYDGPLADAEAAELPWQARRLLAVPPAAGRAGPDGNDSPDGVDARGADGRAIRGDDGADRDGHAGADGGVPPSPSFAEILADGTIDDAELTAIQQWADAANQHADTTGAIRYRMSLIGEPGERELTITASDGTVIYAGSPAALDPEALPADARDLVRRAGLLPADGEAEDGENAGNAEADAAGL